MDAMTMEFKAPAGAIAPGVKEGGMVTFELTLNSKGEFEMSKVEPKVMPKDAMEMKP